MSNNLAVKENEELSLFNTQSLPEAYQLVTKLAGSTIIPRDYQNNPANCLVALEMANRLKASPLMVMQNLYLINGRPAWSTQFLTAMINRSKKYRMELQYEFGNAKEDGGLSCYAWTEDYNGRKVTGPKITMTMAQAEGWVGKNGSKWRTMPEIMIRYRAASFFARANCPDMVMGIYEADEVREMTTEIKDTNTVTWEPSNVDYNTGEVINMEPTPEIEKEETGKIISTAKRKKLFEAIRETGSEDPTATLKELLSKFGYTSTQSIRESDYRTIMDDIKAMIKVDEAEVKEDGGTGEENN